ncbi:MAG: hypothetical protein ACRD3W_22350 [Terriglobales bacterium]
MDDKLCLHCLIWDAIDDACRCTDERNVDADSSSNLYVNVEYVMAAFAAVIGDLLSDAPEETLHLCLSKFAGQIKARIQVNEDQESRVVTTH